MSDVLVGFVADEDGAQIVDVEVFVNVRGMVALKAGERVIEMSPISAQQLLTELSRVIRDYGEVEVG